MLKEALMKVEKEINFKYERVIVLQDEKWYPGVVGIIASRILNRFYRPTIIIAVSGGMGRGSARSIQGFSLPAALDQCREYLSEFGGHPMACGLTLREEHIQLFRESINRIAAKSLELEDLIPTLPVDMELPLSALTIPLLEELEQLEPFGTGNPEPLFLSKKLLFRKESQGDRKMHMTVREEGKEAFSSYEAVISSELAREMSPFCDKPVDLVYHPVYQRGEGTKIFLHVKDFSPS